jgi:iron(II)-dependent oxidoreductase
MPDRASIGEGLATARERTRALVAPLDRAAVERVHSPLLSPLVWDLGHVAAFEDLWLVHRHGGHAMIRPDLVATYDAQETPRAGRGELDFLDLPGALAYQDEVRARVLEDLERVDPGDGLVHELVIRHELQHDETMLQTRQLGHLGAPERSPEAPPAGSGRRTGLEMLAVPGGACTIGAPAAGFAYDNERPRHRTDVRGFSIGRTPVTNASYLTFVEGGGYRRRELWSEEAWAWKEQYDITHPGGWTGDGREWRLGELSELDPDRPVVHVSWFEADAFARAHGARLPTEAEWEKAATWDQDTGTARAFPWGSAAPDATRATLQRERDGGPAPATAHPASASPCGALGMVGDVWEWTASPFAGYPGFVAHPYREYSEVFFGPEHRVLRGGSWATGARVAAPTFRNWDLPQRRQIFAGLRIARDLGR